MKKTTAEIANSDILGGNKPYLQRARLALPVLVRQAKAGQTIHYSDLAEEIDISNPRNLNYPLGAIGNALKELGSRTNKDIPPIQCIVINKDTDLPGEGIEGFIAKDYSKLPKTAKQNIVKHVLAKVFAFPYWDWVLEEFGLASVVADLSNEVEETKKLKGGGEGEHHKKFKAFVAQNPEVLRLGKNLKLEKIEYCLPSGDTVDVMFTKKDLRVAVEVKPATCVCSLFVVCLRTRWQYRHQCLYDPDARCLLEYDEPRPRKRETALVILPYNQCHFPACTSKEDVNTGKYLFDRIGNTRRKVGIDQTEPFA